MKHNLFRPAYLFLISFTSLCTAVQAQSTAALPLEKRLSNRDSVLFDAVLDNCNLKLAESLFTPDFEYYQTNSDLDPGSLTSRSEFMDNLQKRCDNADRPKVKRTTSSVQAFQLNTGSAVQTGVQHFYIIAAGKADQLVETSRFSRAWALQDGVWKIQWELDNLIQVKDN